MPKKVNKKIQQGYKECIEIIQELDKGSWSKLTARDYIRVLEHNLWLKRHTDKFSGW